MMERHELRVILLTPEGWSDSGNGPDSGFAANAVLEALTDAFNGTAAVVVEVPLSDPGDTLPE